MTLDEETAVKLEGIHHITAITGDAPRNVEFYAGTLGLRMVKKTVNQDDPTVYHLFYADEQGSPGADLTFFEYPGAAPGRPGPVRSTASCGASARPRRSTSGPSGSRSTASRPSASMAACDSPIPRASTTSCGSPTSPTRR